MKQNLYCFWEITTQYKSYNNEYTVCNYVTISLQQYMNDAYR